MGTPSINLEREVKLDVGLHFELPELGAALPGVIATRLPLAKLQATYVDTTDLRLMRWGVTLRHRRDTVGGAGPDGVESAWTLKLPTDADGVALVRTELSWPGPFGPVPTEAANLVRAQARTARLAPVAKLLTERRRVELRDGEGRKLAEVDDDVVSVMDGRRLAARFRQVELEITDAAPPGFLEAALAVLTAAGALPGDDRPKVVRAIGPRAALGPDVVIPTLDRRSTVSEVVRAAIASAVTRIIRHDPGVRLGDDPEHVHQARVGTRRLRSDLRTFWRLLDPDWAGPVRAELGWLAAALGEVRDADVLTGRFQEQIRGLATADTKAAAALLRRLATEREEARVRLLQALDSDQYLQLLDNLAAAAADAPLARVRSTEAVARGTSGNGHAPRPPAASAAPAGVVSGHSAAATSSAPWTEVAAAEVVLEATAPARPNGGAGAVASTPVAAVPPGATGPGGGVAPGAAGPGGGVAPGAAGRSGGVAPGAAGPGGAVASGAAAAPLAVVAATALVVPEPLAVEALTSDLAARPAVEVLAGLVRRPWKHLQQAVASLGPEPADEALHEVRIRSKRLRYAAEAASGVVGNPARRLAVAVAAVQGVLGDMQDAVVAEAWLRAHASATSPGQALVAGQLVTVQRQQQAACRARWRKPWKAASRKALRRWLKA